MVLNVSFASYSHRHIGHMLSFKFGNRPLSPITVFGKFSISGPLRPIRNGGAARLVIEFGNSVLGLARRRCVYMLNLLHIKQQSPVKHKSPGIPTPTVKPYLALLERPAWYVSSIE
ncbi:hypothetical protein CR513_48970, partial [Mucuna pruriens]